MSGALDTLRQTVAGQLRRAGVNAVAGMESARASRWREAVAAVSLSGAVCAPGGFQDYLGVRRDPDTGKERELYGRQAELTLAIDVFAPRDGGESACQQCAQAVVESLLRQGAAGLPALEFRAGRVEFLEGEGLYRQTLSCRCGAWLTAERGEGSEPFADFEVRGRMR